MRNLLVAGLLLTASTALADEAPRVDVEVGQTVERNVGYTRGGWMCDDPSLLRAELVTRGTAPNDYNVWVVTGVKEGTTLCRVGAEKNKPAVVFELHVTAARPRR